jgi:hypothetical protein
LGNNDKTSPNACAAVAQSADRQIVAHRQLGEYRMLRHIAEPEPDAPLAAHPDDLVSGQRGATGHCRHLADDRIEQGRLANPVAAQYGDGPDPRHPQPDVEQHLAAAVAGAEVADLEQRLDQTRVR